MEHIFPLAFGASIALIAIAICFFASWRLAHTRAHVRAHARARGERDARWVGMRVLCGFYRSGTAFLPRAPDGGGLWSFFQACVELPCEPKDF